MTADPKIVVVLEEGNLQAHRLRTYWAERSGGKSVQMRRALADALIADMVVTISDPKEIPFAGRQARMSHISSPTEIKE